MKKISDIEEVLFAYGISQAHVQTVSERTYKIDDGNKQYALKRSILTKETSPQWAYVFHQAKKHQLVTVLPILLTRDQSLFQFVHQQIFYLMPWIDAQKPAIENLYQTIGKIHSQTKRKQDIDHEQLKQQFRTYQKTCINSQQRLLIYVKQFESQKYMSPVALQVCTHYSGVESALKKNATYIERFIDELTNDQQWSHGLCHGNLKLDHLLQTDEQSYLINWERSQYNYVVIDLVHLFHNDLVHNDAPLKSYLDSFHLYMKENKLSHQELLLVMIHLLDVSAYMDVVKGCTEGTQELTMIHQVQTLQMLYRRSMFALEISDYLEGKFISILAEDLED